MGWNPNGQQQNGAGYNGPRQPRKIPDPGKGRLRKTQKKTDKSPDFKGLATYAGQCERCAHVQNHVIDVASWYEAPRAMQDGQQMGESWSLKVTKFDPSAQGQQAPQQQQMPMQYPPQQPPVYAQQAPGPAYAPPPQPPQHGGYAPAPGYQPPPPAGAPPQAPQWGGQPQQGRPPQAQAGGYATKDIPF